MMMRTLPRAPWRTAAGLVAALLFSPAAAVHVRGGENASGQSAPPVNDAYSQALREAERELSSQEAPAGGGDGWNLSALLSIVALGLAVGLTAWLRRRLRRPGWPAAGGGRMRLLESLPLGRQATLFLVQVEGRQYWLADHARGVTLLGECPPSGAPPSPASEARPPENPPGPAPSPE